MENAINSNDTLYNRLEAISLHREAFFFNHKENAIASMLL
jgi:hypothetical protein